MTRRADPTETHCLAVPEQNLMVCPLCGEDIHDGDGTQDGDADEVHWWCATNAEDAENGDAPETARLLGRDGSGDNRSRSDRGALGDG